MIRFVATNCTFEKNVGPASVYSDHASISYTEFTNCKFNNNIGNETILLYSSQTKINNCDFTGELASKCVIDARSYSEQGSDPPKITLNDTKFADTNGPVDVLISKYGEDETQPSYTVEYTGTTVADTLAINDSIIEVTGTLVGDITLDETTDKSNIKVSDNAQVVGEVIETDNTYPIFFTWTENGNNSAGTILYLEKDKTYTESEINLLLNISKPGYKLVLYTDSGFKTPWDYVPAKVMQTIYGNWEANTHVYGTELLAHNGGFYY